jgi:hypothetical protein
MHLLSLEFASLPTKRAMEETRSFAEFFYVYLPGASRADYTVKESQAVHARSIIYHIIEGVTRYTGSVRV